MLVFEYIPMALTGLRTNKMRSVLTMLGIIIGIASVIAIMTVGNSMNSSITTSMESMGANNLTLGVKQKSASGEVKENGMRFGAGNVRNMSEEDYISKEMLEEFQDNFGDQISDIGFTESAGSGTAEKGTATANVTVTGVNQGQVNSNDLTILAGRDFAELDQEKAKKVAVVSDLLVENLSLGKNSDALGNTVEVQIGNRYYSYTIIGVYEYEASEFQSSSTEDISTELYIPFETAKAQTHSPEGYTRLTLVTKTGTDTESFMEQAESFFNRYYRNNQYYEVSVTSMETVLSAMTEMLTTISLAVSIIAGISLLVGGIGVMNIMLVSITERTREIGTRKAIGATNASIRLQFITESVVICLLGGFMGILLGIALSSGAAAYMGYNAYPSVGGIVFAVVFSVLIGVFFGYYPANRAAKLNPIEALRYE